MRSKGPRAGLEPAKCLPVLYKPHPVHFVHLVAMPPIDFSYLISAPLRLLARPWPMGLRYGCAKTFSLSCLKGTCTFPLETRCFLARERAVAQLGSALEWGSRGRGFESRQPESRFFRRTPSL